MSSSLSLQVGASLAGYPVSLVKARYGWGAFAYLLIGGGTLLAALLAPLWATRPVDAPVAKKKEA